MVLRIKCRSAFRPVLMPVHAIQAIRLSIQEETFLRIGMKVAETYLFFAAVYLFSILTQYHHSFI